MVFNFEGKKALVLGGGSGIGRECAILFAKSGADVAICDLVPERAEAIAGEVAALGRSAIAYVADVRSSDEVVQMYKTIIDEWDVIDFVVNSAGVCLTEELTEQSVEDINLSVDVNLKGTIYSCREALEVMRPNNFGRIINMSSIAAKACLSGFSVYSATKAAIIALTASLGREAALDNVTVNCICPGVIKTNMWEGILDQIAGEDQEERDRVWETWYEDIPTGQPQEAIDVANMVAFLCTDEARYITSQNIGVDGGYTF